MCSYSIYIYIYTGWVCVLRRFEISPRICFRYPTYFQVLNFFFFWKNCSNFVEKICSSQGNRNHPVCMYMWALWAPSSEHTIYKLNTLYTWRYKMQNAEGASHFHCALCTVHVADIYILKLFYLFFSIRFLVTMCISHAAFRNF